MLNPVSKSLVSVPRNSYIDFLRGISILIVLLSHLGLPFQNELFGRLLLPFIQGYYGVAIFFAISGYLITKNAISRYGRLENLNAEEFYINRASRIFPFLLVVISFLALLSAFKTPGFIPGAGSNGNNYFHAAMSVLTFRFNYAYLAYAGGAQGFAPWAPMWSLSLEEVFYVAFPLAIAVLKSTKLFVVLLFYIILLGISARANGGGYYTFDVSFDCLAFGVLAAIATKQTRIKEKRIGRHFLTMIAAFFGILFWLQLGHVDLHKVLGPSVIAVLSSIFLYHSFLSPHFRLLDKALFPIGKIGESSYEIYLLHLPIKVLFADVFPDSATPQCSIEIFVALSIGILGNHFFTTPVTKYLRRQFSTSKVPTKEEAAPPKETLSSAT